MTDSYNMRRSSLVNACRAVRALFNIPERTFRENGKRSSLSPKLDTLMVHIYTYSSAYWQLPLRMNTHIRRLYDIRIHPFNETGCT